MLNWVLLRTAWRRVGGTSGTSEQGKKTTEIHRCKTKVAQCCTTVREGFVFGGVRQKLYLKSLFKKKRRRGKDTSDSMVEINEVGRKLLIGGKERGGGGRGQDRGCLGAGAGHSSSELLLSRE